MVKHSRQLPKYPEPYWRESTQLPTFPKLDHDIDTDVVIVGGGITGITSAYLLSQHGIQAVLIEAGEILNGTTGHTTAKITAQHGMVYDQLIKKHGEEKARLYYQANKEAIQFIRSLVEKNEINCDFKSQDAILYTNSEKMAKKLQDEFEAYSKLGIDGDFSEEIPFTIPCIASLTMKNQAQFHPLKYLEALLPPITEAGIKLYEQTTAMKIEDGEKPAIITENGHTISADHVITATHFPFNDEMGWFFARMHAERSYVLAAETETDYPEGMYYSVDTPSRSLRYTNYNGKKLVLVGGGNHKTGQGVPTHNYYEDLQDFTEHYLGVQSIPYRWSAQDLQTQDSLPFIGPPTSNHPNIQIATGFAKWGMTNGTIAAKIMTDRILKKENPYFELFDPSRLKGIGQLVKDNADVAKHFVAGKFAMVDKSPKDIKNGEGAIVKVNGSKAGCYRDQQGQIHLVDSTCTHMGCELAWNNGERTWDCPCHGSRFSVDGDVLEGPAVEPLKKISME
ncbi:FAD-dependent oxidoreductase [Bacillus massiliglaciei]|uniref:FAD-dependent oxidoreductase n=1 Tax=Bacillus massiliglaciei TaxID=1816693 RepID=UPI000A9DAF78|nr:FAD-dependent oxidoreductase [Bacillus massiliglaciei]